MAGKNKGKKNNKKSANSPQKTIKESNQQPVVKEDVISSSSSEEFEQNKDKLITAFLEELETLEEEKKVLEESIAETKKTLSELKDQSTALKDEKDRLQALLDGKKEEFESATSTIESARAEAESILSDAKEHADKAMEEVQGEKLKILADAAEKAKDAYKNEAEKLEKQIEEIAAREIALHDAKRSLESEKRDFEMEKAELEDMNNYVMALKERFQACNPSKVEELQLSLEDEKNRYKTLLEKYNLIKDKLSDAQVLLDTIKGEIEDKDGSKHISSLSEIVAEMHELRNKYEEIAAIYDRHPDSKSIEILEEKALRADILERENTVLEQERNKYREEVVAAKNANKELEVIKREVEATNALNEHLLKELESHKTALESRTGDTCPSLSKVDSEVEESEFIAQINGLTKNGQINSLDDLVEHIRNYAGSRKKEEQLFYMVCPRSLVQFQN